MSKLFEVQLTATIVVVGESEGDAYFNAMNDMSNIKNTEEFDIEVLGDVTCAPLPTTWNGDCVPYGGDGNTRIGDME